MVDKSAQCSCCATWSGRGPAPAWLSGVKDCSKFLLDGAAADVSASTETKPSARKADAKKAAAKKAATAVAKKALRKNAAVTAPVTTAESGAELTT